MRIWTAFLAGMFAWFAAGPRGSSDRSGRAGQRLPWKRLGFQGGISTSRYKQRTETTTEHRSNDTKFTKLGSRVVSDTYIIR